MQADTTVVVTREVSTADAAQPFSLTGTLNDLIGKLGDWLAAFILHLPNLIVAVLIVVVAAFIARLVRRVVKGGLTRVTTRAQHGQNVVNLLATLAYVAVLASGVFMALGVLALSGVVTSLLAGAGIVGLALGFAFQDIASNFIAGVFMAVRAPFVVGQLVETNDFLGVVSDIDLRTTTVTTLQGQRVVIPNSQVFQKPLINYSAGHTRRVDLTVGVGYGTDLEHAERVALQAVEALPMRIKNRPSELFYTGFEDSSIDFTVRFWIEFNRQPDFLGAQSAAIKAIKRAFDAENITIPFPIRTLDFGPSGGVAMREALRGTNGQEEVEG